MTKWVALLLLAMVGCGKPAPKYPELDAQANAHHMRYRIWCDVQCVGVIYANRGWFHHSFEQDRSVAGGNTEADVAQKLTILAGQPYQVLVNQESQIEGP